MRITLFLQFLFLCLLSGCTNDERSDDSDVVNTKQSVVEDTLFTGIDFRIENYDIDTLKNYEASPHFFNKYIKDNDAFRINNNNPLVNAASIKYYVVDSLVNSMIKVLIILEVADTQTIGSQLTALILNDNGTVNSTTLLALMEENDAWTYYWRSYIKNDTLHRLSTGMGDNDTTHTNLRLNGFRNLELISTKNNP